MGLATVSSSYILAERGQDLTHTVTLATPQDVSGWTVGNAKLWDYAGGTLLAEGTPTLTSPSTGVWSIAWDGADLDLEGAYVWTFNRTDVNQPIVDPSAFRLYQNGPDGGPSITNFSEYMAFLGMSGNVTTAFIRQTMQLLGAAEQALMNACGRKFTYDPAIVEYYDGWPDGGIQLRRQPVWSVEEVKYDVNGGYGQIADTFGADTILNPNLYSIQLDSFNGIPCSNSGILRYNDYNQNQETNVNSWGWSGDGSFGSAYYRPWACLAANPIRAAGVLKVTYAAGFLLIPDDLKWAIFQVVRDRLQAVSKGGTFQSQSGEGYSYSLGPFTDEEKKLLSSTMTVNNYRVGTLLIG